MSYVKAPTSPPSSPESRRERSSSRRRRRREDSSSPRRRRSSTRDRSRRRRSSSRSRSPQPTASRKAPEGFVYSKASPHPSQPDGRSYPSFDARDHAPEDRSHNVLSSRSPLDPRVPLVRGSFRIEGVNFSKYEGSRVDPERQRAFTSAIRDDIICEAGNGVVREDILLRLTPGPIKSVVLDYATGTTEEGLLNLPSLIDAEWCIDCEYAIAARNEDRQIAIARSLFEALSAGDLEMDCTRKAYIKYINPEHNDPSKVRVVPTAMEGEQPGSPQQKRGQSPHHRSGLYEETDPLEGRYTWHERRSRQDLGAVRGLPDAPRSPPLPAARIADVQAIGGVPLEHRPLPDPAAVTSPRSYARHGNQPWWDTSPSWELKRAMTRDPQP